MQHRPTRNPALSRLRRTLVLASAFALLTGSVDARPDPIGERRRPKLDAPPPAPPPRKASPSGKEKDESPRGVRTATEERRAANESPAAEVTSRSPRTGAAPDGAGRPSIGGADSTYKLGPRDLLRIEIWARGEIEYEWRPVIVTDDGNVYLPLLDNVKVGGLTVPQAMDKLTKLYDALIIEPQVFIQIQEYNSRLVNLTGEVKSPGRYPLKGELTLTEILAEAGGVAKDASSEVRIIRPREGDEDPEVIEIDLRRIAAGDLTSNIKILPGDEISVLPNKNIVYVTGAVKTEGYVEFEDGMTAQQAIILAGGLAEGSAGGRTRVYRVENGQTQQFKVNVKDQRKLFFLKPGDILKVPRSIL